MFAEANPLIYNPDGSHNAAYYDAHGELLVTPQQLKEALASYQAMKKEDAVAAWDKFHSAEWSYLAAKAWCEEHSVNHRF